MKGWLAAHRLTPWESHTPPRWRRPEWLFESRVWESTHSHAGADLNGCLSPEFGRALTCPALHPRMPHSARHAPVLTAPLQKRDGSQPLAAWHDSGTQTAESNPCSPASAVGECCQPAACSLARLRHVSNRCRRVLTARRLQLGTTPARTTRPTARAAQQARFASSQKSARAPTLASIWRSSCWPR